MCQFAITESMKGLLKYSIEQFPKFKDFDKSQLSEYQIEIRNNQKIYKYGKNKTCKTCGKKLSILEFYIKDSKTGRRRKTCRDCELKKQGVIEIGRNRFADKILKKGFRRCSVCKEIKPLTEYKKNKHGHAGYSNNCYECSRRMCSKYEQQQKEEIGDYYVRQYGLRNGITEFTEDIIEQLRNKIIESRKPKYFLDGNEFLRKTDLADYILKKYDIPITTTLKRLNEGYVESDCIISKSKFKSIKSGTNKGKIKVTDTITGAVYYFFNTMDKELAKMFALSTIRKGIKTGLPVGGKKSRYCNPCLIERISNSLIQTDDRGQKNKKYCT